MESDDVKFVLFRHSRIMSPLSLVRFSRHGVLATVLIAFMFSACIVLLGTAEPVSAQSQFVSMVSYRVTGASNYTAPGTEEFWNTIAWTTVPLAASVTPGGGHTPSLLVKSANDGFNIYMLLQWNDSAGPSFGLNLIPRGSSTGF